MNIIDSLITDRAASDVGVNEKGSYDWRDLNRVTEAMEYLDNMLTGMGYLTGFTPVEVPHRDGTMDTRWREDDESMTASRLEAYRQNVVRLRNALTLFPATPAVPERMTATSIGAGDGLTYGGANRIEQILVDLDSILAAMQVAQLRSGQVLLWSGFAIYMPEAGESPEPPEPDKPNVAGMAIAGVAVAG